MCSDDVFTKMNEEFDRDSELHDFLKVSIGKLNYDIYPIHKQFLELPIH